MNKKISVNLFNHYKKLIFFLRNRYKDNNYQIMREYFTKIFISEIEKFTNLNNKKIIDVGGANGEFSKTLSSLRNCDAINLEPNPTKIIWKNTIKGTANRIPFKNNTFDIVICRCVLEHIPYKEQQASVDELYRVTKQGGFCYISIPPWYNPHAGHALKPFHLLPFKIAKFLRQLIFKNKILSSSYDEEQLYKTTFQGIEKMIKKSGFKIISTQDTHFRLHFMTKIPLIREIAVPTVSFILLKD